MKILIISTPKTGNIWLKSLLPYAYNLLIVDIDSRFEKLKEQFSAFGDRWVAHQHYPNPRSEFTDKKATTSIGTRFDYRTINPFQKKLEQEFENGIKITPILIAVYFRIERALQRWPNPFDVSSRDSFYSWLNSPVANEIDDLMITNFAYTIYQLRSDLQKNFPDIQKEHRLAFC